MVVSHNILAMNGNRMLGINSKKKAKNMEKLSSGYRINRSADDAAGLAISEKMRRQIRGLTQASQNIQDGISFCQVADGYLNEVHDILQRINELSVQSANGTNSQEDRMYMDNEVQELKKELHRIFGTAEFNEIRIWDEPYMPEPALNLDKPADIQVFNKELDDIGEVVYGGVEINDVRHTWEELGLDVDLTVGKFKADQEIEFTDYTGERINLKVNEGDPLNCITRNYEWHADKTGISVNNRQAATWEEIGIQTEDNRGSYSFSYHNFDISFTVNDGDSLQDVIDGINGDVLETHYTWDLSSLGAVAASKAVDITASDRILVTEGNKNIIDRDFYIDCYQVGEEEGVTLIDSAGGIYTKIPWQNFTNLGGTREGDFPVMDWGLEDVDGKEKKSDAVTFDDEALYQYKNISQDDLQIRFTFTVGDEASKEAVIAGLDNVKFSNYISAPGTVTTDSRDVLDDTVNIEWLSGTLDSDTTLKSAYGMNPDHPDAEVEGHIIRTFVKDAELDAEGHEQGHYVYNGIFGGEIMDQVEGTLFSLPPSDSIHEDTVPIKTHSGEPLILKYYSNTLALDKVDTHIGYIDWSKHMTETVLSEPMNAEVSADYLSRNFQLQRSFGRDFDDPAAVLKGQITRTFHSVPELDAQGNAQGYFSYEGTFAGEQIKAVSGALFALTEDASDYILSEDVMIETDAGTAMCLTFKNNLLRLGDQTMDFQFEAADYASRVFAAEENTYLNINESSIFTDVKLNVPKRELYIQSNEEAYQGITLKWDVLSNAFLGVAGTNVRTEQSAGNAIDQIKKAMRIVSKERSDFGAYQNRLEHAKKTDDNVVENTTAAESRIRDTDMAKEIMELSRQNILEQVSQSMLSQANQTPQGILSLLG